MNHRFPHKAAPVKQPGAEPAEGILNFCHVTGGLPMNRIFSNCRAFDRRRQCYGRFCNTLPAPPNVHYGGKLVFAGA